MSTNILTIANPFNDWHIELFKNFEKENGLQLKIASNLLSIKNSSTEEEYKIAIKNANEINIILFELDNGKIVDSCNIQGSKDIKTCNISFVPLKTKIKRPILTTATDYALSALGMEEVFISVNPTDTNMLNSLNNYGFENLGEENGYIMYLKEKEEQKNSTQTVQLY